MGEWLLAACLYGPAANAGGHRAAVSLGLAPKGSVGLEGITRRPVVPFLVIQLTVHANSQEFVPPHRKERGQRLGCAACFGGILSSQLPLQGLSVCPIYIYIYLYIYIYIYVYFFFIYI